MVFTNSSSADTNVPSISKPVESVLSAQIAGAKCQPELRTPVACRGIYFGGHEETFRASTIS